MGIGCRRGTPKNVIEQAIQVVFEAHALTETAIAGIATIDTKADEAGLVDFCRDRRLSLRFFSATMLRSVTIPTPSGAIESAVGTPSVAEAAALLACSFLHPTCQLLVPKSIHIQEETGLVTIAVARSLIA